MALFFLNQECPLCQKEITNIEGAFAFPPFIQNTLDPFYQFNDSVVHIECLHKHSVGNRAIRFADQFFYNIRPENRICIIGKNKVKNYDDYIFMDLLTSNEQEALYKFNFTTLDRNNLKEWEDRNRFIDIALKFKEEGKWKDLGNFKYLEYLIETFKI